MLVLTRKTGQQIRIGPDVTITVVSVRGGYVRLGIEAPRDIRIRRGESTAHLVEQEPAVTASPPLTPPDGSAPRTIRPAAPEIIDDPPLAS